MNNYPKFQERSPSAYQNKIELYLNRYTRHTKMNSRRTPSSPVHSLLNFIRKSFDFYNYLYGFSVSRKDG